MSAIGKGTCNFPLNITEEERRILGRAAFKAGAKSTGEFIRDMLLVGLRGTHPGVAEDVERARLERRRLVLGAGMAVVGTCLVLLCGAQFAAFDGPDDTEIEEEVCEA